MFSFFFVCFELGGRVGVHLGFGGADDAETLRRIVEKVEELGFHGLFVSEGLGDQVLEPFSLLSVASTFSERLALGVVDYSLALRHPIVTAKHVSSLQRLSEGRAILGVDFYGGGWALGGGFGALESECLEILRRAWREGTLSFRGRFFRFEGVRVSSQLPEGMDPEVWIEGRGAASVLAAVRYGSGLVPKNVSPEELGVIAQQVRGALRVEGRSSRFVLGVRLPLVLASSGRRAELLASHYSRLAGESVGEYSSHALVGDASRVTERLTSYFEAGAGYVVVSTAHLGSGEAQLEVLEAFARDVAPSL